MVWGCAHRGAGAINNIFVVSQLEEKYGIWSFDVKLDSLCLWDCGSTAVKIVTPAHNIAHEVVLKQYTPRAAVVSTSVHFCWPVAQNQEIIGFQLLSNLRFPGFELPANRIAAVIVWVAEQLGKQPVRLAGQYYPLPAFLTAISNGDREISWFPTLHQMIKS